MTETRAVIDRHIESFNARTPDDEPWSENAELIGPGGTFNGRDGVLEFLSVFQAAFSDGRLTVHSAIVDGADASVEGVFDGVHDGILNSPSGPVPATGKSVSFRWSATYRVHDAELISEHLYFDQLDLLDQLGLLAG
ncbi:ester cyclase [Gordonia polyisoprenivorans]|uniref:ester cyclase n=1 Tax=Gordonia polyisoprenivorans TaxID=84595 RepID=UPI001AD6B47E|nr:nuclear transport factor 2 family protein [Gordonia polyisoprenivorans]QTI69301.1 nuclear transport factor 2 family protein [Gordonia polyisoprenivorans]